MDEFGESMSIYVWPKDHEDGTPYPEDFRARLARALASENIEYETV